MNEKIVICIILKEIKTLFGVAAARRCWSAKLLYIEPG